MLHGKKGFERIVWAFKNVLKSSVTWLFYDFDNNSSCELFWPLIRPQAADEIDIISAAEARPIAKHHPFNHVVMPQNTNLEAVLIPPLDIGKITSSDANFEDWALDACEWLGLVSLQSPRVQASDSVDPYLSRYRVPMDNNESANPCNMVCLSWKGLVPARWIRDLFITLK